MITDTVPEGLVLDSNSMVSGISDGGSLGNDGTLTWKVDRLEPGEKKTVQFTVLVPEGKDSKDFENTAYASAYLTGKMKSNTVESHLTVIIEVPTGVDNNQNVSLALIGLASVGLVTGLGVLITIRRRRRQ